MRCIFIFIFERLQKYYPFVFGDLQPSSHGTVARTTNTTSRECRPHILFADHDAASPTLHEPTSIYDVPHIIIDLWDLYRMIRS